MKYTEMDPGAIIFASLIPLFVIACAFIVPQRGGGTTVAYIAVAAIIAYFTFSSVKKAEEYSSTLRETRGKSAQEIREMMKTKTSAQEMTACEQMLRLRKDWKNGKATDIKQMEKETKKVV